MDATAEAEAEAERRVREMKGRAVDRERAALANQLAAARQRLVLELGRFLACIGEGVDNLDRTMYDQMRRPGGIAQRLRRCAEPDRLNGYPEWDAETLAELRSFAEELPENRRRARLAGSELDAALEDPRWRAQNLLSAEHRTA